MTQPVSTLARFAAALVAFFGALVAIVVIRPLVWRVLATGVLWVAGVTSLIVLADGLDRLPRRRTRRRTDEALHWLSASSVALALAVCLGALVPVLRVGASPAFVPAAGATC
jgi:hypothetical protein